MVLMKYNGHAEGELNNGLYSRVVLHSSRYGRLKSFYGIFFFDVTCLLVIKVPFELMTLYKRQKFKVPKGTFPRLN